MKVSWKWLEDWVDLTEILVDDLVARLNLAGLEVAGFKELYDPKIVVGKILEINDHPKADKLVMCRVDVGDGVVRNIACGAKNMKAGDIVPVALEGARPPGIDFEIVSRPVAGVVSEGMLCAEEELGLSTQSDGLWILPPDLIIGQNAYEATQTRDVVIEVELTPNRADCLSHIGIAREIAALFNRPLKSPAGIAFDDSEEPIAAAIGLTVSEPEACLRYGLAVIENVVVGPSPAWLRHRLAAIGMRSINNIVDVTNYVLMDVGQPLHAFDLDRLDGGMIVRYANPGEKLSGIDHKEHTLEARDLIIADSAKAVAIAGVMGGDGTEVTSATTRVLIECAQFQPTTVRKTAKRLGLHTESSHRFERGIDSAAVERNLETTIGLMVKAQAGQGTPSVRKGRLFQEAAPYIARQVAVTSSRVNQILGTELSTADVTQILTSIGVTNKVVGDVVEASIPPWRPDLERTIDLVEEVARIHGYDKLTPTLPRIPMGHIHRTKVKSGHPPTIISRRRLSLSRRVRQVLLGAGLAEAMNYSFFGETDLAQLSLSAEDARTKVRRVANPLAADQAFMRTSLVPGLLKALRTNASRKYDRIALFEVGRVYLPEREYERVAGLAVGSRLGHVGEIRSWDFFDMKGVVETLAEPFAGQGEWRVPAILEPFLHPGVQAEWVLDGQVVANVGQLHPLVSREIGVDDAVYVFDVDLDRLLGTLEAVHKYVAVAKFPAVQRDFAFLVDKDRTYAEVEGAIRAASELIEGVSLFDVYAGAQVPEGKQSYAVSVAYRSTEKTLTEADITAVDSRIVAEVEQRTGATLR